MFILLAAESEGCNDLYDQTFQKLKGLTSNFGLTWNVIVVVQHISTGVVDCIDQHYLTRPLPGLSITWQGMSITCSCVLIECRVQFR